ncbi:MAG: porin [Gemmatimonadota bacterium]|jgi:phosphate-selective porin OprO/OprP
MPFFDPGRRAGRIGGSCARALSVLLLATSARPDVCRAQSPLRAWYRDDFILETEDGAFQLRIRGNLHLDTRLYQAETRGAPFNLDIRRARIDLMGRIHRRFTFRIQPELSGSPYIRNAWADWEFAPALHLKWGQMKVPFSSSWLTQDNNLDFIERGAASPVHPFFDRGFTVWGELASGTVSYDVGVYTGMGTDSDVSSGDVDDGKELAGRLFLRPFVNVDGSALRGLILVAGGTWAPMTVPSSRIETGGYTAADFGSSLWRWRTEQVLGTDGRIADRVAATIDSRSRLGAEVHYLNGPFALSSEWLRVRWDDIALYHDLYVGSARIVHEPVLVRSGAVRSWTTSASWYLTGESKRLEDGGWRTASPKKTVGEGGIGAWEVLARYSRTTTDAALFDAVSVTGFAQTRAGLPSGYSSATPGAGNSLTASVLDGAHAVNEVSLGLNWTVNPMVRVQLDDTFLWAPASDRTGDGVDDNRILSGAKTAQSDPDLKGVRTKWENAVLLRFVFKL